MANKEKSSKGGGKEKAAKKDTSRRNQKSSTKDLDRVLNAARLNEIAPIADGVEKYLKMYADENKLDWEPEPKKEEPVTEPTQPPVPDVQPEQPVPAEPVEVTPESPVTPETPDTPVDNGAPTEGTNENEG